MGGMTIVFGGLLTALAAYGYLAAEADHRSLTALIPAAVGLPLIVCGWLARSDKLRPTVMHIAVTFSLLGTLAAGGRGLPKLGSLFSDDPDVNRRAVVMILCMFALCLVFTGLCVKSFIDARRRQRRALETETQ